MEPSPAVEAVYDGNVAGGRKPETDMENGDNFWRRIT